MCNMSLLDFNLKLSSLLVSEETKNYLNSINSNINAKHVTLNEIKSCSVIESDKENAYCGSKAIYDNYVPFYGEGVDKMSVIDKNSIGKNCVSKKNQKIVMNKNFNHC